MVEPGVERWLNCKSAIEFSENGIDADSTYPPTPETPLSNFACEHSAVVSGSLKTEKFPDAHNISDPGMTEAAIFHGPGKLSDFTVRKSLEAFCGGCSYFTSLNRK